MSQFRFRMASVLNWRDNECQLETNRLAAFYTALLRKDQELSEWRAAMLAAERALLAGPSITAPELQALEEYRRHGRNRERQLTDDVRQCKRDIGLQTERVKAARIKLRLLEKLRERRLAEHTDAVNRETEEVASDSFLAKYVREL